MNEWSTAKVCDVLNLFLGVVLFFSPLFVFAPGAQSTDAYVCGIIIFVLSIAALSAYAGWEEWLNLSVGLWLIISPWVLNFAGTTAMSVVIAIGIIVAVIAAIELWLMAQVRPWQAAIR